MSQQMSPGQVANVVARSKIDEMNKSIDLAHKALAQIPTPQVPEEVFTVLFLPYFSGKEVPADRNVLTEWVAAAGSAMAEVEIVDTKGEVLYTVPPIFSTDMLKLTRDRVRGDFAEIVTETQMLGHQSDMKASVYAHNATDAKMRENVDVAKTEQIRNSTEERWGQIFDRYGIPRAPGAAPVAVQAKPLSDAGQEDVVYD